WDKVWLQKPATHDLGNEVVHVFVQSAVSVALEYQKVVYGCIGTRRSVGGPNGILHIKVRIVVDEVVEHEVCVKLQEKATIPCTRGPWNTCVGGLIGEVGRIVQNNVAVWL